MAEGSPSQVSDLVSKVLAAFEEVSGYTFLAIAGAGAFILELPSRFAGIDVTPIRTQYGGAILAATILAFCLWLAKAARVAHRIASSVWKRREKRLTLNSRTRDSFWEPMVNPPGIHVHAEIEMGNPADHDQRFYIFRLEVARGRLGWYQECKGLYNFPNTDAETIGWIFSGGVAHLVIDHAYESAAPRHKKPLLFRVRITDQFNRRHLVYVRAMAWFKQQIEAEQRRAMRAKIDGLMKELLSTKPPRPFKGM